MNRLRSLRVSTFLIMMADMTKNFGEHLTYKSNYIWRFSQIFFLFSGLCVSSVSFSLMFCIFLTDKNYVSVVDGGSSEEVAVASISHF